MNLSHSSSFPPHVRLQQPLSDGDFMRGIHVPLLRTEEEFLSCWDCRRRHKSHKCCWDTEVVFYLYASTLAFPDRDRVSWGQ